MKNTASTFTNTLLLHIHLSDLFCPNIPENMKKINIHTPDTETIQYVLEGQQKYPNNIKAQNKEEKAHTDKIWKSQTKESVVSLRLAKMQYKVLSLTLQARNLMPSKITTLQKYFINLGVFVFVLFLFKFVCVLGGEKSTRIILVFSYELLQSKGKESMR